jgi:transposase
MEKIITVGLDLAKSIFQVHGIAENGKVLVRRTLRRSQVLPFFRSLPTCLVGMEACASAHHWGTRDRGAGPLCPHDAASLREALRQTKQDRRGGC